MSTAENLKVTNAEFCELPEGPPYYQLIDGVVHMSPSPLFYHQQLAGRLYRLIWTHLERNPIGELAIAPVGVFLTDFDTYQPDLLFVSEENRDRIGEDGVHGAPDLVVEILSPSTRKLDEGFKRKTYAACGVREYWIVDPDSKRVEVFDFRSSPETPRLTLEATDILESPLFPGLTIPLDRVF